MTLLLGALLAAGILLCASPWLWPAIARASVPVRRGPLVRLMAEAGFGSHSPRTVLVAMFAAGVLAASVVFLLTTIIPLALLGGIAAASGPVVFLRSGRLHLLKQRRQLWPDVCDLLVASIRVGMSLPDAVASLAESAPGTVRPAFDVFARDLEATGRFEDALDRLKAALADPIADRIIETLRMARQVGGTELATVLRALSSSVRADAALRAEVEARQSWIRGAAILGAVAPWIILGLLVMRPEGAAVYGTPIGMLVICVGAAVCVLAFRLMLRVGRLPEPRRWFG